MSAPPDLTQYRFASPEIAQLVSSGRQARAVEVLIERLTESRQRLKGAASCGLGDRAFKLRFRSMSEYGRYVK